MLKKVKKIVALMMATMALSTLFVTTAFAQENDVEVIEEAKILEEIVSYLEDGVTIDVAPNESKRIEIPLSNGESAYLEIGCTPANKTAIPLGSKEQCKARNSFCVSASGEYQVKHKQHPKVGKGTLGCCYVGVPGMGNS